MAQRDHLAILMPDLCTDEHASSVAVTGTEETGYEKELALLPGTQNAWRTTADTATFRTYAVTWAADVPLNFVALQGFHADLNGYGVEDIDVRAVFSGGADGTTSNGAYWETHGTYTELPMRQSDITPVDWESIEDWDYGVGNATATTMLAAHRLHHFWPMRGYSASATASVNATWAKGYWATRTLTINLLRPTPSAASAWGFAKIYAGYAWQPEINVAMGLQEQLVTVGREKLREWRVQIADVSDPALHWKLLRDSLLSGSRFRTFVALRPRKWRAAYTDAFPAEVEVVRSSIMTDPGGWQSSEVASYGNAIELIIRERHSYRWGY